MKKLILALLMVPAIACADAVIFSGNSVKALKQNLNLNDIAYMLTGTDDPSVVPVRAPKGSLYLQVGASGGKLFIKQDSSIIPTTNWDQVGGGVGTVTSVGLSLPGIFSVSGSPVTTSGTLSASLASQTANTVFAAPNGSAGSPTFRLLVEDDIPSLSASKIGSGTFSDSRLSANVALENVANSFTAAQTITVPTTTANALTLKTSDDNAAQFLFRALTSTNTVVASIQPSGDVLTSTDLTTKSYTDGHLAGNQASTAPPNDGDVWTYVSANNQWEPLAPAAGGADTALSNLATTSITVAIQPATNVTYDLGSSSKNWATGYIRDLVSSTSLMLDADGGEVFTWSTDEAFSLKSYNGVVAPSLKLWDKNQNFFTALKASNTLASSVTFTLPPVDGSNGQFVMTDGAGNLTFASAGGGTLANDTFFNARNAANSADVGLFKLDTSDVFTFGAVTINFGDLILDQEHVDSWWGSPAPAIVIDPENTSHDHIFFGSKDSPSGTNVYHAIEVRSGQVTGASATVGSGELYMGTGDVQNSNQASGYAEIKTGNTSGSGNSGSIGILVGVSGSGTRGEIIMDARQVNVSSKKIVNLATPTSGGDAVNKTYVDSNFGNISLSNLAATTAINSSLIPSGIRSLGDTTNTWQAIYPGSGSTAGIRFNSATFQIGHGFTDASSPLGSGSGSNWRFRTTSSAGAAPMVFYTSNVSGNTGPISIATGNASAGNSGGLSLSTGTASGTRGNITMAAAQVVSTASLMDLQSGGLKTAKLTADPCADTTNYPEGTLFYNDTSDYYCFCNGSGADVQMHSPATACF